MVDHAATIPPRALTLIVATYVVNVLAALGVVVVLTVVDPRDATDDAWVHSVVVAVLAVVLVLRLRAAQAGRRAGLRAVGIICSLLFVANLVLALTPGLLPGWLRADAVLVAALMIAGVALVVRTARADA